MRKLRDWILTVPTLLVFGLTVVFFDIFGRICLLFGLRPFEWSMGVAQKVLIKVFAISGTTLTVEGGEHLERGGILVVSNHQSMFDIPIFGGVMFHNYPKFVAKKELAKGIPSVSLHLSKAPHAIIDRRDRAQATEAIKACASLAQERETAVVLFPEGTRSRDGSLGAFKDAGATAMFQGAPDLPVMPAAIDGSWRIFMHNMKPIPFGTKVRIRFGEPIARHAGESAAELLDRCHDFIETTLDEWRGAAPAPGTA